MSPRAYLIEPNFHMIVKGVPSIDQVRQLLHEVGWELEGDIDKLPDDAGQFHSIFLVNITSRTEDVVRVQKCVLRISTPHVPRMKTANEVATMTWVRQNTSIPVPRVLSYDTTDENCLGREFTLLEFCPGVPLSNVISSIAEQDQIVVMDQIIDIVASLQQHEWGHVGGLDLHDHKSASSSIVPGPMVDAHFFTAQDNKLVPEPLSHNAYGPFQDFAAFCAQQLTKSWGLIQVIPQLGKMRDLPIPTLISSLSSPPMQKRLNSSLKYTLAHRDMHLGNMLYDSETKKITAVLDWELAAVLPTPLWNPGNFLAARQKAKMLKLFQKRLDERGLDHLSEQPSWPTPEQKTLSRSVTLTKWIVNGGTRGWEQHKMGVYKKELGECIAFLLRLNTTMSD